MNLHWKNSNCFVWTEGLQTLFVFQRIARQLYCYFYKWTVVRPGDSRFYQDSLTAQVHTSPKVTNSGHIDGCLAFLIEAAFVPL